MPAEALYSNAFFVEQMDGSRRSAGIVVPIVLSIMPLGSVIDVGCGVGPWAAEFIANGVAEVWGVDGDYVSREHLQIPSTRFLPRDLTEPLSFEQAFDLAVCLEVAEHLPESRAEGLVRDLVAMAACVLFSAAIPGPTGTGHINAQYLPYWVERFEKHGYVAIDPIRPRILGNDWVEWFYQQDIIMFAKEGHPILSKGFPKPQSFVHPVLYEQVRQGEPSLGKIIKTLPTAIYRSVRYRLGDHDFLRHKRGTIEVETRC
jgi:SAM-dependent methyltransferase